MVTSPNPQPRRWILVVLACLVVAIAWYVPDALRSLRAHWAVKNARKHLALNEARAAALGIQRALDVDPDHVEALRLKGNLLNSYKDPEAISVWTRVAQLEGGRTNWCIALALAVQMGQPEAGAAAATFIEQNYSGDADALRLLVAHSLLQNELPRARVFLDKLGTLDQTNVWDQFNRATLTLADKESNRKAWAESELVRLSTNQEVAAPAYRVLIDRNLARRNYAEAARYSDSLIQVPGSLWSDRFNHIRHEWLVSPERGKASLAAVLALGLTDEQLLQLSRRLMDWGNYTEAEEVIAKISEAQRKNPRVLAIEVESLARQKLWKELNQFLTRSDTPRHDALLEIYRVRANRELGRSRIASEHTEFARTLARGKPDLQSRLANLLNEWGWREDAALILEQQALENRDPLPAIRRLARYYYEIGATTRLALILERWLVLEPDSLNVKNNYASIHLLLDENLNRSHALASEVAAKSPTNQVFRSTYLFSLLKQGSLNSVERELSALTGAPAETALYQALAHQACGSTSAIPQLLATAKSTQLLPEEEKLLSALTAQFP